MVFCGLYPTNHADYESLREALDKLALNDASLHLRARRPPRRSASASAADSWVCSTWTMVQERIERESGLDIITTAPSVGYEIVMNDGAVKRIRSAAEVPDPSTFSEFREPIVRLSLLIPTESIGTMMTLAVERRGEYVKTDYLSPTRALLVFDVPLAEILFDFYRQAEERHARLRHDGLRAPRLPRGRPREAVGFSSAARRSTRCR